MSRVLGRLAFYTLAALAAAWPVALHPRSLLAATGGPGDPLLNLWTLGWDLSTIHDHPRWLLDGRIFNANIFHPAEGTLAYSDHLIPQAIAMWPLYALTRDVVLCYNALFFVSLAASGLAMHAYVRQVTGSRWGALLAGLAWTIAPFRFAHVIHLQLQGLYVLPLTFLALHRLMARRGAREAIVLGLALALQTWTSVYYGVIGALGVIVGALALMIAIGRWRDRWIVGRLALAAIVAIVLVSPVIWMYSRVQQAEGFGRSLFEAANSAARADSYLRAPAINLVYGDEGLVPFTRPNNRPSNPANPERQLFPGLVIAALAIAGALTARGTDRVPATIALLAVGAAGFLLSLGPEGVRALYAVLHRFVFGFQAIRASARFAVLVHFSLAALAAFGLAALVERGGTRGLRRPSTLRQAQGRPEQRRGATSLRAGLGVLLIAAAALEWTNRADAYMPAPPTTSAVGRWLRDAPEPGAVVHLPLTIDVANTPAMVASLEHRRPVVNGYSGQVPPFYSAVMDALATFPSGDALWTLRELDVRFVVSPSAIAPGSGPASPLVERAHLDESYIYELRWTPEAEAALTPPSVAPPPPAGPMPFSDREEIEYSLFWTSGVARAEAGRAIVTARPMDGGTGAAYALAVEARTAPWIARFFEAQDRFESTVSADLLPIEHTRHIREGRRSLDRTFQYDRAGRSVRAGDLSLPLMPDARDPIGAFFYIRTLAWTDLRSARVPVNDAGRNVVLVVERRGEEAITVGGAAHRALRLDCAIEQRFQRRQPVRFTVWLSADRRRVPLAADVDAGFGRVRAELVR